MAQITKQHWQDVELYETDDGDVFKYRNEFDVEWADAIVAMLREFRADESITGYFLVSKGLRVEDIDWLGFPDKMHSADGTCDLLDCNLNVF